MLLELDCRPSFASRGLFQERRHASESPPTRGGEPQRTHPHPSAEMEKEPRPARGRAKRGQGKTAKRLQALGRFPLERSPPSRRTGRTSQRNRSPPSRRTGRTAPKPQPSLPPGGAGGPQNPGIRSTSGVVFAAYVFHRLGYYGWEQGEGARRG